MKLFQLLTKPGTPWILVVLVIVTWTIISVLNPRPRSETFTLHKDSWTCTQYGAGTKLIGGKIYATSYCIQYSKTVGGH